MINQVWDYDNHPFPGVWTLNADGTVSPFNQELRLLVVRADKKTATLTLTSGGFAYGGHGEGPEDYVYGEPIPDYEAPKAFVEAALQLHEALAAFAKEKP